MVGKPAQMHSGDLENAVASHQSQALIKVYRVKLMKINFSVRQLLSDL